MKISSGKTAAITIFLVLLADQSLKIWIKTQKLLGFNDSVMGDWFYLHFIENNGMAFGMEFGGSIGKLLLSLFRIIAIFGIGWYLIHLIKTKAHTLYVISIALIFAGALGNIIDCAFYGIIFSESNYSTVAQLFPEGGGYSSFLHGRVVDMLYFPIISGHYPDWLPIWGSKDFIFFRPIFNIADSSITIGVFIILLFQKKLFKH